MLNFSQTSENMTALKVFFIYRVTISYQSLKYALYQIIVFMYVCFLADVSA